MKMFSSIKQQFSSFSKIEKLFVLFAMLSSFLISCEYGITRPASQSIFIANYGAGSLPFAWLILVPINLMIVSLYNRLILQYGCKRVFTYSIFSVISINLLAFLFIYDTTYLSFVQYLCKDIYILLMFKQLWSLIHMSIPNLAKFFYGIIFSAGGLGAVLGGMITKLIAVEVGSSNLFIATVPIYLLLLFTYYRALSFSPLKSNEAFNQLASQGSTKEGFALIKESRFLLFILLLVVFMQLTVAFVEYQFNLFLEKSITQVDLRTEYYGKILSIIQFFSAIFQITGGYLLTQLIGLKKGHLMIPLTLFANAVLLQFFPLFSLASFSLIITKTFDFSLFSIGREMLYIPLSLNEKFRAKAVIDVFVYRSAKAFAAVFLLVLEFFSIQNYLGTITMIIFLVWAGAVLLLFQSYDKQVELSKQGG